MCAQGPELDYWWRRMDETMPKWTQLRDTCRAAGVEVMYTVIQSLTADGRDQSLDYKISGFHVPPGSFDAQAGTWLCAVLSQRMHGTRLTLPRCAAGAGLPRARAGRHRAPQNLLLCLLLHQRRLHPAQVPCCRKAALS